MADRGPGRSRTRLTMIIFLVLIAGFVVYLLGYGFGGFMTPDPEEAAEEAPVTEQPVDDFAADEPGPGTDPADQPDEAEAGPPDEDTATGPGDEPERATEPAN